MAEVQVKGLSIRHEAILEFLMANPTAKLGDVAVRFQVSQAWLSVIMHSDAFRAKLAERQDESFGAVVLPLREKLMGVAHQAVDKLGEAIENASAATEKQFIADTADKLLKNLGYSPKSGPIVQQNVQQNYYSVDKETLADAREKMRGASTPKVIEGETVVTEQTYIPEGV